MSCKPVTDSASTGAKAFFTGVGPRALSNGLNSAVFFCFFEIIRAAVQASVEG
jgi:solute carrier family 25 S-adenosylmethionine transporter 26